MSAREAPPDCAARVIDRKLWQRNGALALRRAGSGFETVTARPDGYDRPWARARPQASNASNATRPNAPAAPSQDATPRLDDLDPGE